MDTASTAGSEVTGGTDAIEAPVSAVSWAAIFAGAFVATSVSLILLALGAGMGFASVSPWRGDGASATTFTVSAAVWLIVVQWVASGLGGYLTGRLRTKWVSTHTHEVFFRDTAHGFVTWSLATVIGAVIAASAVSSIVGSGVQAASTVASGATRGATNAVASSVTPYDVDRLFRSTSSEASASTAQVRGESSRILGTVVATGDLQAADRAYLSELIAARAGISRAEAEKRLDETVTAVKAANTKVRQAADAARKAAALASLYTALSMLIGAFIACAAAALGGRQRDEYP